METKVTSKKDKEKIERLTLDPEISKTFIEVCRECIVEEFNNRPNNNGYNITLDDTYVVWYCKTLQNQKGLFSTTYPDGMYYEFTFNGDKKELYMDSYMHTTNKEFTE